MAALVQVPFGGDGLALRPQWDVFRDVEARVGYPIAEILNIAMAQRLKQSEAAIVIFYGAQAAGEANISIEGIEKGLFEGRFATNAEMLGAIIQFLLALLYVPEEAQKKWQAEVEPLMESMTAT